MRADSACYNQDTGKSGKCIGIGKMPGVTLQTASALWDAMLAAARESASGLLATSIAEPYIVRIAKGQVVEVEGNVPAHVLEAAYVDSGLVSAITARRAGYIAAVARTDLGRILRELGVVDSDSEAILDRARIDSAFKAALLADGPWEWRPLSVDGGPGTPILDIMAAALAEVPGSQLSEWVGRLEHLRLLEPSDPLWRDLPADIREFLATIDPTVALREVLLSAAMPPREALAWIAIARRLNWLLPVEANDAGDAVELEILLDDVEEGGPHAAMGLDESDDDLAFLDTPDDITVVVDDEVEPEEPVVAPAALVEIAVAAEAEAEEIGEVEEVKEEELEEIEAVEEEAEASENAAEAPLLLDDAPGPEPLPQATSAATLPPQPVPRAAPTARAPQAAAPEQPFFAQPPPEDLYAILGLPPGVAGQAVTQAYSKRFRRLKKALEQRPQHPQLLAWERALVTAYRILSSPEATALYETKPPGGASAVVAEMAKRALARGIQELRRGNAYAGAQAVQEALTWDDRRPEAWAALGFYQASLDDHDEHVAAFESFSRAVKLAPTNANLRYHAAVAAHFAGVAEAFEVHRAWLDQHRDQAPAAWAKFRAEVAA